MKGLRLTLVFVIAATSLAGAAWADDAATTNVLAPSKVMVLGRYGGGNAGGNGSFTFDNVPVGFEDKSDFTSDSGFANSGGIEALWFPTSGRGFMLTGSLLSTKGYSNIKMEDKPDDYGYPLLDEHVIEFQMTQLLIGLGYRALWDDAKLYGSTFHFKLGGGGGSLLIDGVTHAGGGSGAMELGGSFFRRFDNGGFLGAELDFRGYNMNMSAVEMKMPATKADIAYNGGLLMLSFIGGWEFN